MKQVIILEQTTFPNRYRVAFWLAVPVARQAFVALTAIDRSEFSGASPAELAALKAGEVIEQIGDFSYPVGTGIPAIQALLQAEWATRQATVTATNPWVRYGTSWDGAAWSASGAA